MKSNLNLKEIEALKKSMEQESILAPIRAEVSGITSKQVWTCFEFSNNLVAEAAGLLKQGIMDSNVRNLLINKGVPASLLHSFSSNYGNAEFVSSKTGEVISPKPINPDGLIKDVAVLLLSLNLLTEEILSSLSINSDADELRAKYAEKSAYFSAEKAGINNYTYNRIG